MATNRQKQNIIKIQKLNEQAVLPVKATEGAACFDLYAAEDTWVLPMSKQVVKTGLAMVIPEGYHLQVYIRSGVSLKTPLILANGVGIIDSDYRGEVGVILCNLSKVAFKINAGIRIAQCRLEENNACCFNEITDIEKETTSRGQGGYGSTGKRRIS